jgi:hypothetical protein
MSLYSEHNSRRPAARASSVVLLCCALQLLCAGVVSASDLPIIAEKLELLPVEETLAVKLADKSYEAVAQDIVNEIKADGGKLTLRTQPNDIQKHDELKAEEDSSLASNGAKHLAPAAAAEGVLAQAQQHAADYETHLAQSETDLDTKNAELAAAKLLADKAHTHTQMEKDEIKAGRAAASAYVKLSRSVTAANSAHLKLTKLLSKVTSLRKHYTRLQADKRKNPGSELDPQQLSGVKFPELDQVLKKVGWKLFQIEKRALQFSSDVVLSYEDIVLQSHALMSAERRDVTDNHYKGTAIKAEQKNWADWSRPMESETREAANTLFAIKSLKENLKVNQAQLKRASTELSLISSSVDEDVHLRFGGQAATFRELDNREQVESVVRAAGHTATYCLAGVGLCIAAGLFVKFKGLADKGGFEDH